MDEFALLVDRAIVWEDLPVPVPPATQKAFAWTLAANFLGTISSLLLVEDAPWLFLIETLALIVHLGLFTGTGGFREANRVTLRIAQTLMLIGFIDGSVLAAVALLVIIVAILVAVAVILALVALASGAGSNRD